MLRRLRLSYAPARAFKSQLFPRTSSALDSKAHHVLCFGKETSSTKPQLRHAIKHNVFVASSFSTSKALKVDKSQCAIETASAIRSLLEALNKTLPDKNKTNVLDSVVPLFTDTVVAWLSHKDISEVLNNFTRCGLNCSTNKDLCLKLVQRVLSGDVYPQLSMFKMIACLGNFAQIDVKWEMLETDTQTALNMFIAQHENKLKETKRNYFVTKAMVAIQGKSAVKMKVKVPPKATSAAGSVAVNVSTTPTPPLTTHAKRPPTTDAFFSLFNQDRSVDNTLSGLVTGISAVAAKKRNQLVKYQPVPHVVDFATHIEKQGLFNDSFTTLIAVEKDPMVEVSENDGKQASDRRTDPVVAEGSPITLEITLPDQHDPTSLPQLHPISPPPPLVADEPITATNMDLLEQKLQKAAEMAAERSKHHYNNLTEKRRRKLRKTFEGSLEPSIGVHALTNLIIRMGKCRIPWTELSRTAKTNVETALSHQIPAMTDTQFLSVLHGLSAMELHIREFSVNTRRALQAVIERRLPEMKSKYVSSVITSLGQLEFTWNVIEPSLQCSLLNTSAKLLPIATDHEITQLLSGLVNMESNLQASPAIDGVTHDLLQAQACLQEAIIELLTSRLEGMSPKHMTMILQSAAKLGIHWSHIGSHRQQLSTARVVAVTLPSMHEHDFASTLHALGILGVKSEIVNSSIKPVLESVLVTKVKNMNAGSMVTIVTGLGKLGVSWKDLGDNSRNALDKQIQATFMQLTSLTLIDLLQGLAQMNVSFHCDLSEKLYYNLIFTIRFHAKSFFEDEVATLIRSLYDMNVHYYTIPQNIRWAIENAVQRNIAFMKPESLSSTLYCLAIMDVKVIYKGENLKEAIGVTIETSLAKQKPSSLARLSYALCRMYRRQHNIPISTMSKLNTVLCENLAKMSDASLALVLKGLAAAHFTQENLPNELLKAIYSVTGEQLEMMDKMEDIRNCIDALEYISVDWSVYSESIHEIHRNVIQARKQEAAERTEAKKQVGEKQQQQQQQRRRRQY